MKQFILIFWIALFFYSRASGQLFKKFFDANGQPADSAHSAFYRLSKKNQRQDAFVAPPSTALKSPGVDVDNTDIDTVLTYYTKSGNKKLRAI